MGILMHTNTRISTIKHTSTTMATLTIMATSTTMATTTIMATSTLRLAPPPAAAAPAWHRRLP